MVTKEENELFEIMSSYSEPNDSAMQSSTSEPSEDDTSETSEGRAFVVSDGDQSLYSNISSGSSDYSQHCPHVHDNDSFDINDSSVVQYLVLWRSWEQEKPHMSGMAEET
ncbi:hypothetical protein N7449_006634 [Penicillium cf. viridicatum]|uniref:Uncharacterized protein n=1 Tax=Penicillium cf. viridicatum TaxID=2972119 RepID=A0A9W9JJN5_9EURO|nr:hypothetical protein N7449_006634 [Penicillium cf. viridicatum]